MDSPTIRSAARSASVTNMASATSRRRSVSACPSRSPATASRRRSIHAVIWASGPRASASRATVRSQSSWVVEWQVGAALLSGNRPFDSNGGAVNSVLPNYASSGSVLNIDGLLGLSYWFDTASKLTLGYHADYFKGSTALNMTGVPAENADRVNHGPMIRFSIQK